MNTAQARVPDNNKVDWHAIDIFIFSNGQKYSPPRKYHLRAEELNWWDATLNFLARSQYGPNHPLIHLYTIDGHKVEGPLELKDGAAYVAVEPPDSFINASYDKYLVKASRSWEKRQAKKGSCQKPAYSGCCCPCLDKEKCYTEQICCKCTREPLENYVLHESLEAPEEGGIEMKSKQSKVIVSEKITITVPGDDKNQTIIEKKLETGPYPSTCLVQRQVETGCVECPNSTMIRSGDNGCQTEIERIIQCPHYGPAPSEASDEETGKTDEYEIKLKPKREILHKEGDKGAWIIEFDPKLGYRVTRLDDYQSLAKGDEYLTGSKSYEQESKLNEELSKPDGQIFFKQDDIITDSTNREYNKQTDTYNEEINTYEEKYYPQKVDVEKLKEFKTIEVETTSEIKEKNNVDNKSPEKLLNENTDRETPAKLPNKDLEKIKPEKLLAISEAQRVSFENARFTKKTVDEPEKMVTERRRISINHTKLPVENGRRISSDAGKISTDARKFSTDRPRLSNDQGRRISSEPGRISVDLTKTTGENRRRSGEAGKLPNRRISIEHGRTLIGNGKPIHRDNGDKPLETRTENTARLSSGGATGIKNTDIQHNRKNFINLNRMPLALEYKRRSSTPAPPPPTTSKRRESNQVPKKSEDRRPSKNDKAPLPTSAEANAPDKLTNVSEKTKLILETFSRPGEISTKIPDLEQTIITTTSTSLTRIISSHLAQDSNEDKRNVDKDTAEKEINHSSKSYKNQDYDIASTSYATHYVSVTTDPSNYSNIEKSPTYTKSSILVESDFIKPPPVTSSIKTINSLPPHQQSKTDDDNVITIINKGDVVRLKLNIELNGDVIVPQQKYTKRSRSLTNITTTEKGSQITVDQEVILYSKSLQSLLNNELLQASDGHPKVVIVQCTCGHRANIPEGDSKKCPCAISRDATSAKRMSSGFPVKKTLSNTSLETLPRKGTGFPFQKQDVQMYVLTTNSNCQTGESRECSVTKRRVSITEGPEPVAACNQGRTVSEVSVTTYTQYCVSKSSLAKQRQPTDTWTQTDLCNILLEARRHQDGQYSFHLPPLHVLRYYNLK